LVWFLIEYKIIRHQDYLMITIKNFNQQFECHTARQVLKVLNDHHKEKSVTLAYVVPSGIQRIVFVDVNKDGSVVDSYKDINIDLAFLTNIFQLELNNEA
jgi:hypothetical protein